MKPTLAALVVVLASATALSGCASSVSARGAEPPRDRARPELVVMTYNVNFGLEGDPATLAAIGRDGVDLVLLQETTPGWEGAIRRELGGRYPHMQFRHSAEWPAGGLAVLSKGPLVDEGMTASPVGWFPGWRVVASTPIGSVRVVNVHLRPPLSDPTSLASGWFSTKKDRRREIERYVQDLDRSLPTLVAGDFNEDEDGRAVGFLAGLGLASVLPQYARDQPTWRWTTSLGPIESRLDHVIYDPSQLESIDARVFEEGRSDHLPVVARFAKRADDPR